MQRFVTPENKKWWTLGAVSVGLFMIMLDNTVVNVALPSIRSSLGMSIEGLEWVVAGYALTFAAFMLVGGKLADFLGRRLIFMVGLAVFTGASLACGLAPNGGFLIGARVVQGLGGALMNPATLSIITATFAARERGKAIGIWAGVSAMALAIGPLVGGLLTEHVNWNWIFFINVPIGIIGLFATPIFIAETRDESAVQSLDIPGLAASAVGLFSLTYAFIEASNYGWTSARILGAFAIAAVALVSFALLELHQRAPMLDLTLFRNRTFSGANAAMLFVGLAMFGTFFFVSLYMQNVLGYSPVQAGASFLPDDDPDHPDRTACGCAHRPCRLALARRRRDDVALGDALLLHDPRSSGELLGASARALARRRGHGDDDDPGDGGRDERRSGRQGGHRLGRAQFSTTGGRLARDRRDGLDRRERQQLSRRLPRRTACRFAALPRRRRSRGDRDPQGRAPARGAGP